MKFLTPILGFGAVVAAVDIRFHRSNNCGGTFSACTNIGADTCCAHNGNSVNFINMPNRVVECRTYRGGRCSNRVGTNPTTGFSQLCVQQSSLTGAGYGFRTLIKKRGDDGPDCKYSVEPDTLFLEDGSQYDLVGMSESQVKELVEISVNATSIADVPIAFKRFEKKA